MPNKIDELFSPERLRRTWQKTQQPDDRPIIAEEEGQSPLEMFELLQRLITRRFSGDEAVVLNLLLEELHLHLCNVFPADRKMETPPENKKARIPAIHEVLNRIEDLVDAFEIAGASQKRK